MWLWAFLLGACSSKSKAPAESERPIDRSSLHAECAARACAGGQECLRYPLAGGENAYTCEIRCGDHKTCPAGMICRALPGEQMSACYFEDDAEREAAPPPKPNPVLARMNRNDAAALLLALEQAAAADGEARRSGLVRACTDNRTCAETSCLDTLRGCSNSGDEQACLAGLRSGCPSFAPAGEQATMTVDDFVRRQLVAASQRARVFLSREDQSRLARAQAALGWQLQ